MDFESLRVTKVDGIWERIGAQGSGVLGVSQLQVGRRQPPWSCMEREAFGVAV